MKKLRIRLCVAACGLFAMCSLGAGCVSQDAHSPRRTFSLDQGWRFHLGDVTDANAPGYDDRDWRRVDVPHDYVVEGTFDPKNSFVYPGMDTSWYSLHGFLPVQPAMYRKTLFIPASAKGKRLWVEFDGVFSNSRYWLNGRAIGSQYSGYTRSRFDITDAAVCGGSNILAQVLVQSASKCGPMTLTATSPGLESASVSLTAVTLLPAAPTGAHTQ